MKRNPLYIFTGLDDIGIYDVPLNSTVQINDVDGNNSNGITKPKIIQLIDKTGLYPTATVGVMLNLPGTFIDINEATEIPSELEKITQNGRTGWRVLGRVDTDYASIGSEAFDFTKSQNVGLQGSYYGASGDYSFTTGFKTSASGWSSISFGVETISPTRAGLAAGQYNIGSDQNNILEIGVGTGTGDRRNALEITVDGTLSAPEMTIQDIINNGNTSLVTKEYSDNNLDNKLNVQGGVITGDLIIEGVNPNLDNSLVNKGLANFQREVNFDKNITLGLDSNFHSSIIFTDSVPTAQPTFRWNTSLKDFFVDTHLSSNQRVWHEGNDGAGSGLDADSIHGIPGNEISTISYTDNGLNGKFDKIGGDIFGNITVVGDTDIQGLTTTNSLLVDLDSTFTGAVQINNSANITGDLNINGGFFADTIDSNITAVGEVTFNALASFNSDVIIGADLNRESNIIFTDTSSGTARSRLLWSTDNNEFFITKPDNIQHNIWHAGNFNPLDVNQVPKTFDDLSDTPASKIAGQFIRVSTDGLSLEYSPINNTGASWGSIVGDMTTQSDLTTALNTKFDKFAGGSIIGPAIFQNTTTFQNTVDIQSDLNITGGLIVPSINSNVILSMGVDIEGITNVNSFINLNGTVTIGADINNKATINFADPAINPTITWDQSTSQFVMTNVQGADRVIWNSGNYNPSTKYDVAGGTITGAVTLNDNLTVFGNVQFGGVLTSSGAVVLNNTLDVTGVSTFADVTATNVHITNTATIDGAITVSGTVSLTNNVVISGTLQADNVISLNGDTTIAGQLITTNIVDINGQLNANNAVINMPNLPIIDPLVPGQLWNNAGVLSISL